jgi:protease PrsW
MTLIPVTPPAQPAAPRSLRHNNLRTALIIFGLICACSCTVISLGIDMLDVGTSQWLVGIIIAILPMPVYVSLVLWLDRFEPEPGWMLGLTFFWGAIIAGLFASIFNTVGDMLVTAAAGATAGTLFAYIISAPVVEESAKGLALLILFFWKRKEFDNVTDGIMYAAMAGLGFAMTENALYYGRQFDAGGLSASLTLFMSRGVLAPYLHPMFTAMTGAGLGWAAQNSRGWMRWAAPLFGFCTAVALHGTWNTLAIIGDSSNGLGFLKYACVSIPAMFVVLMLVFFSLRDEGRVIGKYLLPNLENKTISQEEYDRLRSAARRSQAAWRAFFKKGFGGLKRERSFQQAATHLAFHRWKVERGVSKCAPDEAIDEETCLEAVMNQARV